MVNFVMDKNYLCVMDDYMWPIYIFVMVLVILVNGYVCLSLFLSTLAIHAFSYSDCVI